MRRAILALGLLSAAAVAAAQANQIRVGATVNAYFFSSKRLSDAFGDPTLTYGVNLSSLVRPRANKLSFQYDILTARRDDSVLFVVPLTAGYEVQAPNANPNVLPYARIDGGVSYNDVAIHNNGDDKSFKTFGVVASAEVGVVFQKRIGLKAKYFLFQDHDGVNLSGAQVGLVYTF